MLVREITFDACTPWGLAAGRLTRPDGRYFSVVLRDGLYIDQSEIGLLSIIVMESAGEVLVVVHAKEEPGNVGMVQLAPTVQATESNYLRIHGGEATPLFAEAHPESTPGVVLSDSLQSEHGSRFWKKRNRNVMISMIEPPPVSTNLAIARLDDLLDAMFDDYVVNTDARSVLAATPWRHLVPRGSVPFSRGRAPEDMGLARSFASRESQFDDAIAMLERLRSSQEAWRLGMPEEPICDIATSSDLRNGQQEIRFVEVSSSRREVTTWRQPLYYDREEDIQTLITREATEGTKVLLRARHETGLLSGVEFGLSLSKRDSTGHDLAADDGVQQWLTHAVQSGTVRARVMQSEEGGRFMDARCAYSVVEIFEKGPTNRAAQEAFDRSFIWVNLRTLNELACTPLTTTNELRSGVSLLLAWL